MLNLSAEEIRSLVTATAAARDKRAVKALKKLALDDPMSFLITAWALDEGICGPLPAADPLRKFLGRVLRSASLLTQQGAPQLILSLNDSLNPARTSRQRGTGSAKNLEITQTIILSLT